MFRNYLNIALRNLWKNKLYSFINIGGLALGLAVAILIVAYVQNELSYDKWVPQQEEVYRVYRKWGGGGKTAWTPDPLARAIAEDIPEVVEATSLSNFGETLLDYQNDKRYVEKIVMTDSTFFEVVPLPLLYGNPKEALRQPLSMVLSRELAEQFFGPVDPVGKFIRFNDSYDYTVTGVLADFPGHSHLEADVIARRYWEENTSWTANNRATYVQVQEKAEIPPLEEKLTGYINPYIKREYISMGYEAGPDAYPAWELQPFADVHLYSGNIGWRWDTGGDIKYVYIFGLIAVIVLFIACINYVNLATARATGRAKEVGVRKVSGAGRRALIGQFMAEAGLQTVMATILAVVLAQGLLPFFNQVVDRQLQLLGGDWNGLLLPLFGLMIVVSLLAGGYPAFVLSGFQPVKVLKGVLRGQGGGQLFRRVLVITQFSLSVVLVIVMLFIYKQVNYMMDQQLGFAGDQVIVIPVNTPEGRSRVPQMKDELLAIPGVKSVTAASRFPGDGLGDWGIDLEGTDEKYYPRVVFSDDDYLETLGLELIQGRFFAADRPADTSQSFVVNEAFVKQYGLENPIGHRVKFMSEEEYAQIIGVVRDYHHFGLDRPIYPMLIGGWPQQRRQVGIQLSTANLTTTIAAIRDVWEQIEPAHPMRYAFLDRHFAEQYEEYGRFGRALLYATILTIFVAMLGLFGLATYAATTRTKEIGIRKVLGASVRALSLMLIRDFVRWVLIASLLAAPVAYLLSRRWLEDFAYQTELSALPFVLAILAALLLATLTVSFQALRAATGNPVEALRYE
jgi:putative ABC transport system permease protein